MTDSSIFSFFKKTREYTEEKQAAIREELTQKLARRRIDVEAERIMARQAFDRALAKARTGGKSSDTVIMTIARNEMRIYLSIYRYFSKLDSKLREFRDAFPSMRITPAIADMVRKSLDAPLRFPETPTQPHPPCEELNEQERQIQALFMEAVDPPDPDLEAREQQCLEDLISGKIGLDDVPQDLFASIPGSRR